MAPRQTVVSHPNRDLPASKTMRATVVFMLVISAILMAIVAIGGWTALSGQKPLLIALIFVYLGMAYLTARWYRGVLPLAASIAIIIALFALISGPTWFARDEAGLYKPLLPVVLLGIITYMIVPVQALLIAFAARGFQQQWQLEVEQHVDAPSATV